MVNGVGWSGSLGVGLAVAVALVAALLVYRDARRHGSYHALSATGAVAIAGLVGYAVGGVVGLFVGTGYVLLLYLLSYPTTPTVDPSGPKGDAGENIASEDAEDTLSVIRVEVATYETLQELATRYDDVPEDAPEAKLRSALRAKALAEVGEQVDGERNDPGAADTRPNRGLSDPDAPAARASEYGIEEWSRESATAPTERTGGYDAAEWTATAASADERGGDDGVAAWRREADAAADTAAERPTDEHTETQNVSQRDERPTRTQDRPTEELPDRNDELAAGAQHWVAANVDRDLGVTVGEALDTSDVRDDAPDETEGAYDVDEWSAPEPPSESTSSTDAAEWSAEEPPAETDTEQTVAEWSSDGTETNGAEASVTAEAEAAATTNGSVWDTAGEETEQPDSEQATGMVFDNAIEREETDGERTGTEKPAATAEPAKSKAESGSEKESSTSASDSEEASSGDDDPFDGRGELYDGDGNPPSSSQT